MIIANDKRTFTQLVADAHAAARIHAAPFAPTRSEIEERLVKVVDHLESMDDPEAFIRESYRPGHWDAVVVELFRRRAAGGRK